MHYDSIANNSIVVCGSTELEVICLEVIGHGARKILRNLSALERPVY